MAGQNVSCGRESRDGAQMQQYFEMMKTAKRGNRALAQGRCDPGYIGNQFARCRSAFGSLAGQDKNLTVVIRILNEGYDRKRLSGVALR